MSKKVHYKEYELIYNLFKKKVLLLFNIRLTGREKNVKIR